MEPVIGYDTFQCIIFRGSENLQKEMNFEKIVCMKSRPQVADRGTASDMEGSCE